jgi:hypothetical protein
VGGSARETGRGVSSQAHTFFANLHLLPRKNREVGEEGRWIWTARKKEERRGGGWVLLEEERR